LRVRLLPGGGPLACSSAAGAKFLIIGAHALAAHGAPRASGSGDLDIWVQATAENAARVLMALRQFGAPLLDLSEADLCAENTVFQIGVPPSRIDILTGISRVEFDDAWEPARVGVRTPAAASVRALAAQSDGLSVRRVPIPSLSRLGKQTQRPGSEEEEGSGLRNRRRRHDEIERVCILIVSRAGLDAVGPGSEDCRRTCDVEDILPDCAGVEPTYVERAPGGETQVSAGSRTSKSGNQDVVELRARTDRELVPIVIESTRQSADHGAGSECKNPEVLSRQSARGLTVDALVEDHRGRGRCRHSDSQHTRDA
jgi:hypothetical protein